MRAAIEKQFFHQRTHKIHASQTGAKMDRRAAAAWVASMVLAGCGGGGGGDSVISGSSATGDTAAPPAPAPGPSPAPAPVAAPAAAPISPNIAAWGDSLTPPFAANLQVLYPSRLVYDGGIAGQTSTEITARELADNSGRHAWISVFWYGQNNPTAPDQVKADIASSIAALSPGNNHFLVLSVVNEATPEEIKGGSVYATIIQLNTELAALYPQNFIDIRGYLVSQFDPSKAQDVVDFQNDVVPSSLRFDVIHLNNDGSVLVAKKVKEFIDAKGW